MRTSRVTRLVVVGLVFLAVSRLPAAETKKLNDQMREIAGESEFLRLIPKHYATLKAVDPARQQVTLLIEGEIKPRAWNLTPDAEVKVAGWWGRLDQFTIGDRVWAWFKTNRADKPVAIFMLADELSEQDIHGPGVTIAALGDKVTLKPVRGKNRVLGTGQAQVRRGKSGKVTEQALVSVFKVGEKVHVQSAGERLRLVFDGPAFEAWRAQQKAALRKEWLKKGLPGTVTFLHLSGEMDYMLDHEAMRWGRWLKPGDQVSLRTATPIRAVVKKVQPWRERTQLRLVVKGPDLADLNLGQRVGLQMTPPPAKMDSDRLPPDLGRLTGKKERVEWFLASIYCTCGVHNNVCTGQFYTLASCNPNACGMPNHVRQEIGELIDKGLTDRQIFETLLKEDSPDLLRPHLLP